MRHVTLRNALRKIREEAELTADEKQNRSPKQTGKMTQAEAAQRIGAPRETWNKWESQKKPRGLSPYYASVIVECFDLEEGALDAFVDPRQVASSDEFAHLVARVDHLEALLERVLGAGLGGAKGQVAPK